MAMLTLRSAWWFETLDHSLLAKLTYPFDRLTQRGVADSVDAESYEVVVLGFLIEVMQIETLVAPSVY